MADDKDQNLTVPSKEGKDEELTKKWLNEISLARSREKKYIEDGEKISKIYEGGMRKRTPFNILFANTETLLPAVYNSPPKPRVGRRFKDSDPVGKEASNLLNRMLSFLIDPDNRYYTPFDMLLQSSVLQALVAGRGLLRFEYEANIDDKEEKLKYEMVCGKSVPWDHISYNFATEWEEVFWLAFHHDMTKEEIIDNFKKDGVDANKLEYTEEEDDENGIGRRGSKDRKGAKLARVYEIWDKEHKEVIFIAPSYQDKVLRRIKDPLGLSGFFPCPKPIMFHRKVKTLLPVAPYAFYENQAQELNKITVRIDRIVDALKVRGFYNSRIEGIDKVLSADDNTLIPANNVADDDSFDKSIFLMPIEKLITVLQQLYVQREQVKQVIYEITGIADIMRGSSQASETLGAQQIKNQWGTLRLRKAQKEVIRFARDCLRIMAEIGISKLSAETLKQMTQVLQPLQKQKDQALKIIEQSQINGQQVPPDIQQIASQASVEELKNLLDNDLERSYRIDIETDSTIEEEVLADKQDMAEMMNALSQFLNGISPAVSQGVIPFDAAKAMLMGMVRRFRFGDDVESLLQGMQAPQPPQPDQGKQEEAQAAQAKAQAEIMKAQSQNQQTQLEGEYRQKEHQYKMEELEMRKQLEMLKFQKEMAMLNTPDVSIKVEKD